MTGVLASKTKTTGGDHGTGCFEFEFEREIATPFLTGRKERSRCEI